MKSIDFKLIVWYFTNMKRYENDSEMVYVVPPRECIPLNRFSIYAVAAAEIGIPLEVVAMQKDKYPDNDKVRVPEGYLLVEIGKHYPINRHSEWRRRVDLLTEIQVEARQRLQQMQKPA